MKFESYLKDIAGISIYPMISLIIFFVFFTLLAVWVWRMKKEEVTILENLPLADNGNQPENSKNLSVN